MSARAFPIVVILGATGTGKSKLAIEIAQKFNGEIVSADSMQVYKGLDIVTNKVTSEERSTIPHHMLDYVDPLRSTYSVVDFKNTALPIIAKLQEQGKLPIIVGGTNYYIESILWKFLLDKSDKDDLPASADVLENDHDSDSADRRLSGDEGKAKGQPGATTEDAPKNVNNTVEAGANEYDHEGSDDVESLETRDIYSRLMMVDPESAQRIHPHDRRKLIRALNVYEGEGVTMTERLRAQHGEDGAGALSGPLRYPHACVIWIQAQQQVLDERTDRRVESMVDGGLLDELTSFHQDYNKDRLQDAREADYTHGIFQSIGFKEFHEYLILPPKERDSEKAKQLLDKGLEDMKTVTRRYARKQRKWIVNRFLKRRGQNVPPVYAVDSTDVKEWDSQVYQPAVDIVQAFLLGQTPPGEPLVCEENTNQPEYNVCDVCALTFVNSQTWQAHIQGRKHKKAVASKLARERRAGNENKGDTFQSSDTSHVAADDDLQSDSLKTCDSQNLAVQKTADSSTDNASENRTETESVQTGSENKDNSECDKSEITGKVNS